MKKYFFLFSILLFFSCIKEREIPICIEDLKPSLMEIVDANSTSCENSIYIDEYKFQNGYVYYIPIICYGFVGPGAGYIQNEDCEYMTEIGLAFEGEFNGEKFSETAVFERRVWSYEK